MAITMASTDPKTLAAAFIAQAHSTEFSDAFLSPNFVTIRRADRARSPVGKGMPITKPSGARRIALTSRR